MESVQLPPAESPQMSAYFSSLTTEINKAYAIARAARKKGHDPVSDVEIPLARDMAERVEGLISIVAPQLVGKGVIERIKELEGKYNRLAWEVALIIAEEVAKEKFCTFKDRKEAMEVGIRTGFAYNTLGIVSAPLEGFIELRFKKRADGKEYVAATYAGPIRGAGGTAAAFSVILTDYVRMKMGYASYDPTDMEIKRYITEVQDYHERVTNLQYFPSEQEIEFFCRHLPVEVDGEPTEEIEVSNYKGLPRIETNKIRGGMCLVIGEGLTQKSKKIWNKMGKFAKEFGLNWEFLEEFLKIQKTVRSQQKPSTDVKKAAITPDFNFIKDLVAGRPILSYPLRPGGFRLRYGRSRATGFSAAGLHPNTLALLFDYIATGTQLRLERPGKACSVIPIETIDPPIVLLDTGQVLRVESDEDVKLAKKQLAKILYLGDILINYGDFSESGHMLIPSGYCPEWWFLELRKAVSEQLGQWDATSVSENLGLPRELCLALEKDPITTIIDVMSAFHLSSRLGIPLHPTYTFFWKLLDKEAFTQLFIALRDAEVFEKDSLVNKIVLKYEEGVKSSLEILGVPHLQPSKEHIVIEDIYAHALLHSIGLGACEKEEIEQMLKKFETSEQQDGLSLLNGVGHVLLRDKAGTFIGARMGRPEKAKMRKLKGSPHVLFPVGDEGGKLRSFKVAIAAKQVEADFPVYICPTCSRTTVYALCHMCAIPAKRRYIDMEKGGIYVDSKSGDQVKAFKKMAVPIGEYMESALRMAGMSIATDLTLKGVKGTSNEEHIPEHIIKGLLREKNEIYVNKDGTTRYDMSELPITHFTPEEIGTPIDKLLAMGYVHDMDGTPLERTSQILELKPQDLILPAFRNLADDPCDDILYKIANFIDDLLVRLYKLEPYYNFKSKKDVIGHLVVGLAPHISAGMIGRVIGFSQTQGMLAHPLYHASLRRDCDGDEACVMLLMDALLNFSRQFLPNRRGAKTMDSPLVLTTKLLPSEVDDQVHGVDVASSYPLEFYEAALEYKPASTVRVEQIKHRLDTPLQYEGMRYTHALSSINAGIRCSSYKTLETMNDKLMGQMKIARLVAAVDEAGVASLVVQKHFLKDIKGNLRKFSTQAFCCSKCNESYRRPPLIGKCTVPKCGGAIKFTVSEGSIIKYLQQSVDLVRDYNVSPYLRQVIELTSRQIDDVFGKDKEKQTGLGSWA